VKLPDITGTLTETGLDVNMTFDLIRVDGKAITLSGIGGGRLSLYLYITAKLVILSSIIPKKVIINILSVKLIQWY
jgi:hypothetical protein